ncbi:hypothetical protein OCS_04535 [Ophiocordyceps sinensis CO18]|nr:hypothetical protein OCS_04535 [Ophiocordyceps sinensis CO18]
MREKMISEVFKGQDGGALSLSWFIGQDRARLSKSVKTGPASTAAANAAAAAATTRRAKVGDHWTSVQQDEGCQLSPEDSFSALHLVPGHEESIEHCRMDAVQALQDLIDGYTWCIVTVDRCPRLLLHLSNLQIILEDKESFEWVSSATAADTAAEAATVAGWASAAATPIARRER